MNEFMARAIELAKRGVGAVDPNPLVGAVIVRSGKIIGEGWHQRFGGAHAEINAFKSLKEDCKGAEMYVTLEPCAHYGKTPPCALAVAEKGIKKVYIGITDPNPKVAGKGAEILRNAGIEVEIGVMEKECRELNRVFLKHITTAMPYVLLKCAASLDGKTACCTGESKWISCEESRKEVMELRNYYMGIMAGINTVLADDPRLTCRLEGGRDPYRIIIDSKMRLPLDAKVIGNDGKCIVAAAADSEKRRLLEEKGVKVLICGDGGKVGLKKLMYELGAIGINGILLEGGGTLAFSAMQSGIVDRVRLYTAPMFIGGTKTAVGGEGFAHIADCPRLENISVRRVGNDIVTEGDVCRVHGDN